MLTPKDQSPNHSLAEMEKADTLYIVKDGAHVSTDVVATMDDGQLNTASYEVDPFSAQRAAKNDDDYVEFRTMGWIKAGLVSTAESIALGLLSFPSIMHRLGMVGGVIATVGLGIVAYLTAWILVDFKLKHMGVMHFGDAGGVLFGRIGSLLFGIGLVAKCVGLAGSHVLVGQTALSSISSRAICSVWYGVLVVLASIMMSYNRQWGKLWWMSFVSIACILVASMITIVATGVQSPSVLETPALGPIEWHAWPQNPSLMSIIGGLTNILFAFGGNMGVFSFCSEMQRPNDFKKSFVIVQAMGTSAYTIVGAIIYAFGGQYVTSPALTMTSKPVRITAYSISIVTIMVSGILAVNIGAKYIYVHTLRRSALLTSKSLKAQVVWMGMVSGMWIAGFLVAELIPFFNALLTIVSSLFSVWYSFGFAGMLWLHMAHPYFAKEGETRTIDTPLKCILFVTSVFTILFSIAITPLGLYSAIQTIIDGYTKGSFSHPFTC